MDIETIVKKHESALRTYRYIYICMEFFIIFFSLFIVFSLFNMSDIFSVISIFEPYTGVKYNIFGFKILFETLGILVVEFFLSLIITIIRSRHRIKKDAINILEEKHPVLNERLRTAYDNRNLQNIIIDDLKAKVLLDIASIKPSELLDPKIVKIGIGLMLLTGTASTYIAVTDYHTDVTPKDLPGEIPFISGKGPDMLKQDGENIQKSNESRENLFGPPAVIVVEGTKVDLKIPPGAGQGFTSKEDKNKTKDDFSRSAAYDPSIVASKAYYENLPEGYKTVIQSYFENMAEK